MIREILIDIDRILLLSFLVLSKSYANRSLYSKISGAIRFFGSSKRSKAAIYLGAAPFSKFKYGGMARCGMTDRVVQHIRKSMFLRSSSGKQTRNMNSLKSDLYDGDVPLFKMFFIEIFSIGDKLVRGNLRSDKICFFNIDRWSVDKLQRWNDRIVPKGCEEGSADCLCAKINTRRLETISSRLERLGQNRNRDALVNSISENLFHAKFFNSMRHLRRICTSAIFENMDKIKSISFFCENFVLRLFDVCDLVNIREPDRILDVISSRIINTDSADILCGVLWKTAGQAILDRIGPRDRRKTKIVDEFFGSALSCGRLLSLKV